jgi:hypothetical protein
MSSTNKYTERTADPTTAGSLNYHIQEFALAMGFGRLTKDLVVTKLITNYSSDAANQGSRFASNVRVPKRGAGTVNNVAEDTAVTPSQVTSTKVDLPINKHKTWDILVRDGGSLFAQEGLLTGYLMDGAGQLAEQIEADVIAELADASATVTSATVDKAYLAKLRKTSRSASHLFAMGSPSYIVWGPEAEESLLQQDLFVKVNESGSESALRDAFVGKIYGFENYTSNLIAAVNGQESNLVFQRDALGIAFVDMNLENVPGAYTGGVNMVAQTYTDDQGVPAYSMRSIIGYSQKDRGTLLTVDTIYGVETIRAEHLINAKSGTLVSA